MKWLWACGGNVDGLPAIPLQVGFDSVSVTLTVPPVVTVAVVPSPATDTTTPGPPPTDTLISLMP